MPCPIENYAIIGNCETVALVGNDGSIDWLGLPRFDSPACFAALLGEPAHGRWLIAPADMSARATRGYCGDTLVLETVFRTGSGAVRLTDFMIRREGAADVLRMVTGLEGEVAMRMELIARFDYGSIVAWVSKQLSDRIVFLRKQADVVSERHLGNFPQAFSHLALINAAYRLRHAVASAKTHTDQMAPPGQVSGS